MRLLQVLGYSRKTVTFRISIRIHSHARTRILGMDSSYGVKDRYRTYDRYRRLAITSESTTSLRTSTAMQTRNKSLLTTYWKNQVFR